MTLERGGWRWPGRGRRPRPTARCAFPFSVLFDPVADNVKQRALERIAGALVLRAGVLESAPPGTRLGDIRPPRPEPPERELESGELAYLARRIARAKGQGPACVGGPGYRSWLREVARLPALPDNPPRHFHLFRIRSWRRAAARSQAAQAEIAAELERAGVLRHPRWSMLRREHTRELVAEWRRKWRQAERAAARRAADEPRGKDAE